MYDARLLTLQQRGACRLDTSGDIAWHFEKVSDGRIVEVRGEPQRKAMAEQLFNSVCINCPVRELCLDYAIDSDEIGCWAGTTRRERRRMAKERRKAARERRSASAA